MKCGGIGTYSLSSIQWTDYRGTVKENLSGILKLKYMCDPLCLLTSNPQELSSTLRFPVSPPTGNLVLMPPHSNPHGITCGCFLSYVHFLYLYILIHSHILIHSPTIRPLELQYFTYLCKFFACSTLAKPNLKKKTTCSQFLVDSRGYKTR